MLTFSRAKAPKTTTNEDTRPISRPPGLSQGTAKRVRIVGIRLKPDWRAQAALGVGWLDVAVAFVLITLGSKEAQGRWAGPLRPSSASLVSPHAGVAKRTG